jgi:maleylpyruvate isomerase
VKTKEQAAVGLSEDELDLMQMCTEVFLRAVDDLPDGDFAEASRLPGWTRAHVVAHVHFNALALRRLLSWSRTGVPSQMYPSLESRTDDIEQGSRLEPAVLRRLVRDSGLELEADLESLPPLAWDRPVVTMHGKSITATRVPWIRAREMAIHAIDLDAGVEFAHLPREFNDRIIAETVETRTRAGEAPVLAAWLTGRSHAELSPWL